MEKLYREKRIELKKQQVEDKCTTIGRNMY